MDMCQMTAEGFINSEFLKFNMNINHEKNKPNTRKNYMTR